MTRSHRSTCPIARALEVVGDKWTLLLIRDMGRGKHTYQAFLQSGEGIPTNILAARLKRLIAAGLVEKRAYQKRPLRHEYVLTEAGHNLAPVVSALEHWGTVELGGAPAKADPLPAKTVSAPRNEWAFGPEDSVW